MVRPDVVVVLSDAAQNLAHAHNWKQSGCTLNGAGSYVFDSSLRRASIPGIFSLVFVQVCLGKLGYQRNVSVRFDLS